MRMEVIEVSKVIRKHTVLDSVSCSMHSGKIYGIQGINGSGKTMLMRVLIGLIHPSSGKVLIDGKELGKELEFLEKHRVFVRKSDIFRSIFRISKFKDASICKENNI